MQCRTCGYSLWNIRARSCPECATPFKPSDFEFAVNSVRYACPHCGQAYYGTAAKGHLHPVRFNCVKCAAPLHMDEMVLQPSEGITDTQTTLDRMPWLESDRGLAGRWLATIKWAMVQPNRLIRAVPEHSSVGAAWLYAATTTFVFVGIGVLLPQVFILLIPMVGGGLTIGVWGRATSAIAAVALGSMLLLVLWPLTAHALLRMTGGPVRSMARTSHAIYYSCGANALTAVPCCGLWPGFVWWIVSATNMVKEAHGVHGGRAAFAVLTLPLIAMLAVPVLWYAWFMFAFVGAMGGAMGGGTAWSPQNMPVWTLSSALVQYGYQNSGAGPEHALELMLGGSLNAWGMGGGASPFCYSGTKTTDADVPVNDGTFESFRALPRGKQLGEVQKVLESMPANVIAHRFGDFVFTHHGATLNSMDANLWIVVMLPDPAVNGPPQPGTAVLIGTADYNVTSTTYAQLAPMLQQQNQYRTSISLPPLPDPGTVTHEKPAVNALRDQGSAADS